MSFYLVQRLLCSYEGTSTRDVQATVKEYERSPTLPGTSPIQTLMDPIVC